MDRGIQIHTYIKRNRQKDSQTEIEASEAIYIDIDTLHITDRSAVTHRVIEGERKYTRGKQAK